MIKKKQQLTEIGVIKKQQLTFEHFSAIAGVPLCDNGRLSHHLQQV